MGNLAPYMKQVVNVAQQAALLALIVWGPQYLTMDQQAAAAAIIMGSGGVGIHFAKNQPKAT